MVKKVHFVLIFILLLFGFIMRCELFHAQLENSFYSYYQAYAVSISDTQFDLFKRDIVHEGWNGICCEKNTGVSCVGKE